MEVEYRILHQLNRSSLWPHMTLRSWLTKGDVSCQTHGAHIYGAATSEKLQYSLSARILDQCRSRSVEIGLDWSQCFSYVTYLTYILKGQYLINEAATGAMFAATLPATLSSPTPVSSTNSYSSSFSPSRPGSLRRSTCAHGTTSTRNRSGQQDDISMAQ